MSGCNADLYGRFIADVVNGLISPGQRIGEVTLGRRWGVGRTPVREAMYRLEQDGLILRRPKVGTYVRKISLEELHEIYMVRAANEALIAPQVALVAGATELDELEQLADKADCIDCTIMETSLADQAFHTRLYELSRLYHAPRILRLMRAHLLCIWFNPEFKRRHLERFGRPPVPNPQPDHRRIVQVLRARDPAAAADVVRQHLQVVTELCRIAIVLLDIPQTPH
jgi:DNA-binding GntR family transcriptional regulator